MMVPPLSERPVTEEDEEQFRRESMPRKYTLRQRWADYRADARANRPKGVKARVRAWLHVEPFYWGDARRLRRACRWCSLRRLHQRSRRRLVARVG